MLRFRSLLFCVVMACGSSGDDVTGDSGPGTDATTDGTKNDSTTDSPISDSPISDSPIADSPDDTMQTDGGIMDGPFDAPLLDSGVGCMSNNDCNNKSQYCEKGTNNCGGTGSCTAKPQFCPQIYAPVCGCDKVKYANSCFAHAGGTSVWYNSPCE